MGYYENFVAVIVGISFFNVCVSWSPFLLFDLDRIYKEVYMTGKATEASRCC
jgi:hypothetical protein